MASSNEAKEALLQLLDVAEILDARSVDVKRALKSHMPDYEDALLAQMAHRNHVDIIITRNTKDFEHSPVPAMAPRQFIELYKPNNVEYAVFDATARQGIATGGLQLRD
ncbi:MAG: hypothetical protein FWD27_07655 [Coriobacteriia bacterium]|nr:hypothetical protein [Coriobacteriia bacterium]